jgi:hypothetical protein
MLDPVGSIFDIIQNEFPRLQRQVLHNVFGWDEYFCILLQQLGKVLKERVLGTKEVKLVVPLLPCHQSGEKLTTITSYELGR